MAKSTGRRHFAQQSVSAQLKKHIKLIGQINRQYEIKATQTVSYGAEILYNGLRFPPVSPTEAVVDKVFLTSHSHLEDERT
ncbi:MAG: hypothetical protein RR429_10645 [Hafnia sp.]|uniref:hypothetical protein n=2 Tax=Obesumbacterium proteus TaxID=82983 RepID=UPI0006218DEF|nr:hypothetical protein [Obesumbacterium proteus]KKI45829.1 hypothetical protein XK97_13605 [Obesumbacterium proteus]MCE9884860.1 hypothetical protein [Obesumbacterium proteus]MCE9914998.1 hypothetical protein [Obesumbacterium proteus]MCE9931063.1 hypothetical protein [Obesumbacterium proteus]MCG2875232.1 hypothetical protein [Obesumbacterium proteus]